MPFPIIPAALAAGEALGSWLKNRKPAKQEQRSTSSSTSTSSTRRYMDPAQTDVMKRLDFFGRDLIENPMSGLSPIINDARERTVAGFSGVPQRAAQATMAYGQGGASGRFGRAMGAAENAKALALSGLEANFAQMGSQRQLAGANILQDILGQNMGADSYSSGTNSSTGTGTSQIGSPFGAAVGDGLGTMAALYQLTQLLNGAKTGGGIR